MGLLIPIKVFLSREDDIELISIDVQKYIKFPVIEFYLYIFFITREKENKGDGREILKINYQL